MNKAHRQVGFLFVMRNVIEPLNWRSHQSLISLRLGLSNTVTTGNRTERLLKI